MAKNDGIAELRNKYGQAKIEAEMEGNTLPPIEEWIKSQTEQAEKQKQASNKKGLIWAAG